MPDIFSRHIGKSFTLSIKDGVPDRGIGIIYWGILPDGTRETVGCESGNNGSRSVTCTIKEKYVRIARVALRLNRYSYAFADRTTVFEEIQLEFGDTAHPYERFIEPATTTISLIEPLRKVGDVADYIDYANQAVVRNLVSVPFTSKQGYSLYSSNGGNGLYLAGGLPENVLCAAGICTHARVNDNALSITSGMVRCGSNNRAVYWFGILDLLGLTTIDEFKAWLDAQTIPVEVVCERVTPITEPIDLPKLVPAFSVNTFVVDTETPPSNISISYSSEEAE